jgi:hypothetical protein
VVKDGFEPSIVSWTLAQALGLAALAGSVVPAGPTRSESRAWTLLTELVLVTVCVAVPPAVAVIAGKPATRLPLLWHSVLNRPTAYEQDGDRPDRSNVTVARPDFQPMVTVPPGAEELQVGAATAGTGVGAGDGVGGAGVGVGVEVGDAGGAAEPDGVGWPVAGAAAAG